MSKAQKSRRVKEISSKLRKLHQKGDAVIELTIQYYGLMFRLTPAQFIRFIKIKIQELQTPVERFDDWKNIIDSNRGAQLCKAL